MDTRSPLVLFAVGLGSFLTLFWVSQKIVPRQRSKRTSIHDSPCDCLLEMYTDYLEETVPKNTTKTKTVLRLGSDFYASKVPVIGLSEVLICRKHSDNQSRYSVGDLKKDIEIETQTLQEQQQKVAQQKAQIETRDKEIKALAEQLIEEANKRQKAEQKILSVRDEMEGVQNFGSHDTNALIFQIAQISFEKQIYHEMIQEQDPEKRDIKIETILRELEEKIQKEKLEMKLSNQQLLEETRLHLKQQEELDRQVEELKQAITDLSSSPMETIPQLGPEEPLSFSSDRIFGSSIPPAVQYNKWLRAAKAKGSRSDQSEAEDEFLS